MKTLTTQSLPIQAFIMLISMVMTFIVANLLFSARADAFIITDAQADNLLTSSCSGSATYHIAYVDANSVQGTGLSRSFIIKARSYRCPQASSTAPNVSNTLQSFATSPGSSNVPASIVFYAGQSIGPGAFTARASSARYTWSNMAYGWNNLSYNYFVTSFGTNNTGYGAAGSIFIPDNRVRGCTNPAATNYNPAAEVDDGSCVFPVPGCTNPAANNYNPSATVDDGSCVYDQCSNITGYQSSIPSGYTRGSSNSCLFPTPTCTPTNATAFAGSAFTVTANYRNNSSATLDVTSVAYSGAASGTLSNADIGGSGNRTYTTNSNSINTPNSYTITWRMDYSTLYGGQNVTCNSTVTISGQIFGCGAVRNETVETGQSFTTFVNINNPNPSAVQATPITYSIASAPAGSTNPSGNGTPSSVNIAGNGSGVSNTASVTIFSPGTYTINWSVGSPYGARSCSGTITVIFTPPACSATLPAIQTGQFNRPTFTFTNNSSVGVQVTSATYSIQRIGPGPVIAIGGTFSTGFSPAVSASIGSNRTYPSYPPAVEVGPFTTSGNYRLTWTSISYTAAGSARTITTCATNDSTVRDAPYLRAYGNDVITCDLPGSADYGGVINTNGTYVGAPNESTWRGSASELAFFAAGTVNRFLPGAQRDRPSTVALAFSNNGASNGSTYFGGSFGGGCEIRELPDPNGYSSGGNFVALNSLNGRYQRTTDTTIATAPGGSSNINNKNIVIYVAGDITIANKITYNTGLWNIDTIPSVKVFATGNIFIAPSVTQLDGEYVAGGQLYTCATSSASISSATFINSNCRSPLVINGNIKAERIHFLRANGTILNGTSFEAHASPNIAESIRFSPDAYLLPDGGGLTPDPGGAPPYDSIIARPPTF